MPDTPTAPPVETENSAPLTSLIQPVAPDENVSVSAPEPQPIQPVSPPQLTETIPSETLPNNPDIERQYHEAWWRHALGKVADTMTDNETWHIRRDPKTGEVSAQRDPSSLGEKWGRIAATALGGAAAGLANSQGPGGLARATAAGTQFGLQQPQQRQQEANQQVEFENKQLLNKANRIHLTQQTYLMAQQAKLAELQYSQESQETLANYLKTVTNSPNSQDLGPIDPSDPNSVLNLAKKNPNAMDAYLGKSSQKLMPVLGPDHKVHMVITDRTWEEKKNTEAMEAFVIGKGADGKPALQSKIVPPGGDTVENINNHNLAVTLKWAQANKDFASADADESKANRPPQPKTLAEMNAQIAAETNPARKAQLIQARDVTFKEQMQLRGQQPGGGPGSAAPKTPEEQAQFLSTLSPTDASTVRAIGEIRNAPPNRTTKEGQRIMGLVNEAYPEYDSTNYPAYLKTKLDYAPGGTTGKGLNFIGTALAHMDRMEGNIDALHNVSVPVVGSWWNSVKNAAMKGTSPQIKAFVDDQKAVTNEIARAYNGGAITQGERDHMMDLISTSDSPEAIRGSINEFRELIQGKLDQYVIGWDAQMPRGQRNGVLDHLLQRGTNYRPAATPNDESWKDKPTGMQGLPTPVVGPRPNAQPNPPAARTEWKQGAPIFDAKIYMHVHPDKPVADAIKRAQDQGMNVINDPHQ